MNIICDLFLFNFILLLIHQFSIHWIPFESAVLLSAIIAISSANTITLRPRIRSSSSTKSFITKLKKKGLVLFPYGQPLLMLIAFLLSINLIYADESIHFAIKSSFLWFFKTLLSFYINIWWSIVSNAFFRSNNAIQEQLLKFYRNLRKLINLDRWTSHPCLGTKPN